MSDSADDGKSDQTIGSNDELTEEQESVSQDESKQEESKEQESSPRYGEEDFTYPDSDGELDTTERNTGAHTGTTKSKIKGSQKDLSFSIQVDN